MCNTYGTSRCALAKLILFDVWYYAQLISCAMCVIVVSLCLPCAADSWRGEKIFISDRCQGSGCVWRGPYYPAGQVLSVVGPNSSSSENCLFLIKFLPWNSFQYECSICMVGYAVSSSQRLCKSSDVNGLCGIAGCHALHMVTVNFAAMQRWFP